MLAAMLTAEFIEGYVLRKSTTVLIIIVIVIVIVCCQLKHFHSVENILKF